MENNKAAMAEDALTTEEFKEEVCRTTFKKYDTEVEKCCRTCNNLYGTDPGSVAIPGCSIRNNVIRSDVIKEFSGRVPRYELDTIYGLRCSEETHNFSKQCCDLYEPKRQLQYERKLVKRALLIEIIYPVEPNDPNGIPVGIDIVKTFRTFEEGTEFKKKYEKSPHRDPDSVLNVVEIDVEI